MSASLNKFQLTTIRAQRYSGPQAPSVLERTSTMAKKSTKKKATKKGAKKSTKKAAKKKK